LISIFFLTAVFLIFILFIPVKLSFSYVNGKMDLNADILFFKFRPFKKKIKQKPGNLKEGEKEVTEDVVGFTERLNSFMDVFPFICRLTKKFITAELVEIKIVTGTGDAALTAISCGALWAIIYNMLGVFACVVTLNKTACDISPDYTQNIFTAEGKCIFSTRIAYIIFITVLLLLKFKSRKGKEE